MGWTYFNRRRGEKMIDTFRREFGSLVILDCATVNMREVYMAAYNAKDEERKTFAIVCLINFRREDYYNFGYKDMDETMLPYAYNCPARILKLLSPPEVWNFHEKTMENIREWRRRCYENIEKKKKRPGLKTGALIKSREAIKFTDGSTADTFRVYNARRLWFRSASTNRLVTITRACLNRVGYEVLEG